MSIASYELQQLFQEAIQRLGYEFPAHPLPADGFIRWGKNNHYSAAALGEMGVYLKDFVKDEDNKFFLGEEKTLSPVERQERYKLAEAAKLRNEQERQKIYDEVAEDAEFAWAALESSGYSSYLLRKQIQAHGIRFRPLEKSIIIPARDADGKLYSFQTIYDDNALPTDLGGGNKRFLSGGRIKGCFHIIGSLAGAEEVIVCEGYATGATLHEITGKPVVIAFNAGNIDPVITAVKTHNTCHIIIAADNDQWKASNTGLDKAKAAAKKYGCLVVAPSFSSEHHMQKPTDWNDLFCLCGKQIVLDQWETQIRLSDISNVVEKLAQVSSLEFELVKKAEAEKLGISAAALTQEVKKITASNNQTHSGLQFPDYEPWPTTTVLSELLDEIAMLFNQHSILPRHSDTAITLWSVFTWLIDQADTAPILAIASPEKGCGKTTVLSILDKIVCKPLATANITGPALFRTIEGSKPTILIDEADTFLKYSDDLRGIINSGHKRHTAFVIRTVGDDHEPKRFNTWCAKALAFIGTMPDTIQDRSIWVSLRKKLASEKIERLRNVPEEKFDRVRRKLCRFVKDNSEKPLCLQWELPDFLSDRAADNWEPLLAIAHMAGLKWYEKALTAAVELSAKENDVKGVGVELLEDIRPVIEQMAGNCVFSADLVAKLCSNPELRWSTYNNGRPITPKQIAQYLLSFRIKSGSKRDNDRNAKGYYKSDFKDAFDRYLVSYPPTSVTTSQELINKALESAWAQDCDSVTGKPLTLKQEDERAFQKAKGAFSHLKIIPPNL